jgi:hypothetical protein
MIGGIFPGAGGGGHWTGWRIPDQTRNAWICPNWHPAYLLRSNDPVLDLWFRRHLESGVELIGAERPWENGLPDYPKLIRREHDPERAAGILRKMRERGGPIAFDYECNMLKPDGPDAEIVSCAVCWRGKRTIAFPWVGDARSEMREILADGTIPKIAQNLKFEDRWTRREFGRSPKRGWAWDTMLASHLLDNRGGVCGLKFQAYVRLGVPPYDAAVSDLLKAPSARERNRIRETDLADLLLYNGMDALLTYQIAQQQRREFS